MWIPPQWNVWGIDRKDGLAEKCLPIDEFVPLTCGQSELS